jgi:hypothetical protein
VAGGEDFDTPADLAGNAYISAVRSKASQLKTELINQTLNDMESWRKAVNVQWANAHPDQPDGPHSPISPQEYADYQNRVAHDYYEWVEPAFERYLKPDPDAANAMIDVLGTIESSFQGSTDNAGHFTPTSPALSRITDALIDMDHWQGQLQENFVGNFLSPLQNVSRNEGSVANAARELLLLNKIHYIRYRKSVLNLLDTSIRAVQLLNNQRDPKPCLWGTLVAISIGTVLTAGTGGVLAVGIAGIVAGTLGQGLIPDPPEKNDLAAPTAQEVAVNITNAMTKLDQDTYHNGEEKLERSFRDLYATISELRSNNVASNISGPLNVARPDLDAASPADILGGSFVPSR